MCESKDAQYIILSKSLKWTRNSGDFFVRYMQLYIEVFLLKFFFHMMSSEARYYSALSFSVSSFFK
jgi:hypothetical protein